MQLTYLDANSWLIEMAGARILLDPWLVGPLMFSNQPWFFKGERSVPCSIPENIDLILLSQGLPDHAHPETLEKLDHALPVVGSPNAAKVVQKLGYQQITALAHGENFTWGARLSIKAVPGSPLGPTLVENGYLLKDLNNGSTIYYEPHGYHSPTIKEAAPVDVAIAPVVDLKIPLLPAIIQGRKTALPLCKWLEPQIIVPTAAGGNVIYTGLLNSLLKSEGSEAELRSVLAESNLSTEVIEATSGKPLQLNSLIKTQEG